MSLLVCAVLNLLINKFLLLVQTQFVNIVIDVGGGRREDIWSEQ